MEEIIIQAARREVVGSKVKALRREGKLPAILYGRDMDPVPVTLDDHEISRLFTRITSSSLVKVELDGEQHPALIRETQRDILRGSLIHVDFQVVSLTETVRADVKIQLVGEAPAVLENSGILVTGIEVLEVECLPEALPDRVTVDISGLIEIGDAIYVRDLSLPDDVEVTSDPDELVVLTTYLTPEEILEEEEEEELLAEVEEPEVIERGKREEEEQEEED